MSGYIKLLGNALKANPDTRWSGILSAHRVVETESGYLSFNRDRELLALVSDDPEKGYVYGHVLRVDPEDQEQASRSGAVWAALLLFVHERLDADTEDLLFQRCRYWIQTRGRYSPCHAQERDDVFVMADSFEEAVAALAEMIRRFDYELRLGPRHDQLDGETRYVLDMRCFSAYGGIMASWDGTDPASEKGHEPCP